jgi:hypothetical protein
MVPVWQNVTVEAESVDDACRLAVDTDNWERAVIEYDCSTDVYVESVCLGRQDPNEALGSARRAVPRRFMKLSVVLDADRLY